MARELAEASPVFAARLAECAQALAPYVDWDLREVLAGADGAPDMEADEVVQPALWAVMVSLAAVWQAAGVTPDAVVGHSQGEIAAAAVAGILSLAGRGEGGGTAQPGAGGARRAGRHGVRGRVSRDRFGNGWRAWDGRLSIATVNGPAATVVLGEPAALAELLAVCEAAGVRARRLPVDYASHSPQVEQIRDQILSVLAGVVPPPAVIPMISTVTGRWLDGLEAEAAYWYDNLRAPVEFDRAVRVLAESRHQVFIEVSPHPVLTAAIAATLDDTASSPDAPPPVVTGTLRRDDGGPGRVLLSLAAAYVRGAPCRGRRIFRRAAG